MDAAITFEIPGQPCPQPRARMTRSGHTYTPDNGIVAYKAAVVMLARVHGTGAVREPYGVAIDFVIERPPSHYKRGELRADAAGFPPKRAGDWDNLAKGVCDAITDSGSIWVDDDQVVEAVIRRRYAAAGEPARTVVSVWRLAHAPP
jgi:Holliday junction resolvase RusA-like endonuclease